MKRRRYLSVIMTLVMLFAATAGLYAYAADADQIAAGAVYTPVVLEDETKTVYISISVEDNTDLSKIPVCCEVSKILFATQSDYADETYSLMSLKHITGELALHAIVYVMTDSLGGEQENNPFHNYYEESRIADLNINESRIPSATIEAFGSLYIILDMFI